MTSRFREWEMKVMNSGTDFSSYDGSPDNLNVHRSILNPAYVTLFLFFFHSLQPLIHTKTGIVMSHVSHFVYI